MSDRPDQLLDAVKSDLYQLGRDVEKYQDMVERYGTLHPATVSSLVYAASRVQVSVALLSHENAKRDQAYEDPHPT